MVLYGCLCPRSAQAPVDALLGETSATAPGTPAGGRPSAGALHHSAQRPAGEKRAPSAGGAEGGPRQPHDGASAGPRRNHRSRTSPSRAASGPPGPSGHGGACGPRQTCCLSPQTPQRQPALSRPALSQPPTKRGLAATLAREPGRQCPHLGTAVSAAWSRCARIEIERVRFDTQLLQNPSMAGLDYQRGTLAGWEVRAYLLEKWNRRCAYCGASDQALEVEHLVPKSRGGSDRISNLALACHACNQAKGNLTAAEFGHAAVQAQAKQPLADAAAMNATRSALVERLRVLGLPVTGWSGGRTRWNRDRFGLPKTHALDALCVGDAGGSGARMRANAADRGSGARPVSADQCGWCRVPTGLSDAAEAGQGFQTGDLVQAKVPAPLKTSRKPCRYHRGARQWLIPGRKGGWDQLAVLSPGAARRWLHVSGG